MSPPAGQNAVRTFAAAGSPPVLLLHPWWGITPAVTEWAADLAGVGRRVLVPDLYGGRTAATIDQAEALSGATLSDDATFGFIQRCADELAAQEHPWAAMGFSMGGFLACSLAGRGAAGPDELILFYGGQPPAGEVSRTRRVVLRVAPGDEYFTDTELAEVEGGFRAAGSDVQTFRYHGSGHWFAEHGSPGFDEPAFELARSRVIGDLRVAGR